MAGIGGLKVCSCLLLALEFLIAVDIIATVIDPTLEEIAILASILVIRTVISFFLEKKSLS